MLPNTRTASAHSFAGALSLPSAASPMTMKAASPSTTTTAPPISRRLISWLVKKYPSGSANTIVVTRSGWITASRPFARATAWNP